MLLVFACRVKCKFSLYFVFTWLHSCLFTKVSIQNSTCFISLSFSLVFRNISYLYCFQYYHYTNNQNLCDDSSSINVYIFNFTLRRKDIESTKKGLLGEVMQAYYRNGLSACGAICGRQFTTQDYSGHDRFPVKGQIQNGSALDSSRSHCILLSYI